MDLSEGWEAFNNKSTVLVLNRCGQLETTVVYKSNIAISKSYKGYAVAHKHDLKR